MAHAQPGNVTKRKQCRRCGKLKPKASFSRRSDASDGRQSYCKSCYAKLRGAD